MVDFEALTPEQRAVVDSDAPISLVLGGAGVGKTTTALWAARRHLTDDPSFGRRSATRRTLFVTFSRMNGHLDGQVIALFVMVVAAAEVVFDNGNFSAAHTVAQMNALLDAVALPLTAAALREVLGV